jgi:hypothetical protein
MKEIISICYSLIYSNFAWHYYKFISLLVVYLKMLSVAYLYSTKTLHTITLHKKYIQLPWVQLDI